MAHFPASPSMSRLAGSSGTQKVCETTKSRNRTGGRRWSKSRARHPPAHAATSLHSLTLCQAAKVSGLPSPDTQDSRRRPKQRPSEVSSVFRKRISLSDGSSRSVAAYHKAAGVRSLVLVTSLLELIASGSPSRTRYGTTSCTVTSSLTKVCVCSGCSESLASFDGGCQQIATTAITVLWQHSSQGFSGWFGGSRQTVKSRHFVPTAL